MEQLVRLIADQIAAGLRCVIANQNLHGAYLYFRDAAFRDLHARAFVHIDGMPLGTVGGIRARVTLPLWAYVSVTGVVIYWMLYRL